MIAPGFEYHRRLFAGVAPEVKLMEHVTRTRLLSANKAVHYGIETQRRRHQKSETGVSVALQKNLCPQIFFKENKSNMLYGV